MKPGVLHSHLATEPITERLQQRAPLCSPTPFFPLSPLHPFHFCFTFFAPHSLTPTLSRALMTNHPLSAMKEARTIWLERESRREQEKKMESVCSWKRETGRRRSNCVLVSVLLESDINLNTLFKAFLHHEPWFISGSSPSIYQNKLWAHSHGQQGKLKQTAKWEGEGVRRLTHTYT